MDSPAQDNARMALEILTAWASEGDGDLDFVIERAISVAEIAAQGDSREIGMMRLIFGLTSIGTALLVQREDDVGIPITQTLHELGMHFADE